MPDIITSAAIKTFMESANVAAMLTTLGLSPTSNVSFAAGNFTSTNAATVVATVTGASGQTAKLQEWKNSAGTVLASIDPNGNLKLAGLGIGIAASAMASVQATNATGTISVSGPNVTGSGTSFTTEVSNGDHINVGGVTLTVNEVDSDTSLTLTGSGPTLSGQPFVVLPDDGIVTDYLGRNYLKGIGTTISASVDIGGGLYLSGVGTSGLSGVIILESNVTGSDSASGIFATATWNTTGAPSLIYASLTDTASNPASLLIQLQVGGVDNFSVSKAGAIYSAASTITLGAIVLTAPPASSVVLGAAANGATTQILVGGGASALAVWTTATGSGAPVRATSPTLATPNIGAATGTNLVLSDGLTIANFGNGSTIFVQSAAGRAFSFGSNGAQWSVSTAGNLSSAGSQNFSVGGYISLGAFTVGTLPTATAGRTAYVTDSNAALTAGIGAVVAGGGANVVPVFADGTNWRIG